MEAAILCVLGLVILMMMGTPIVFSLGFVSLCVGLLEYGTSTLSKVGWTPFYVWFNINWLPLPLFVLLGSIIAQTSMGADIFNAGRKWLSRVPGGLISAGIIGQGVMAAALGTSAACILVVGQAADKEFKKHNYDRGFGLGALLAGGVLGPLIPPSATMIIYAILTDVSIGRLFMAGIIPGIILAVMYCATAILICWRNPNLAPPLGKISWGEKFASISKIWSVIIVIIAALGSIYSGVATPTEAAGMACMVTLVLGITVFNLRWAGLRRALEDTAVITGIMMFVLVGASLFSYVMGSANVGKMIYNFVEYMAISPWMVIVIINIIILALGFIVDPLTTTFLTIPILVPLITALGFDPIWFGIVFVVNSQIGLITPPMALDLFTAKVYFNIPTLDLIRGVIPFLIIALIFLVIIISFPGITLWLPSLMVKG